MKILIAVTTFLLAACAQTVDDFLAEISSAPPAEAQATAAEASPQAAAYADSVGTHSSRNQIGTEWEYSSGTIEGVAVFQDDDLYLEAGGDFEVTAALRGAAQLPPGQHPVGPGEAVTGHILHDGREMDGYAPFEGWVEYAEEDGVWRGAYEIEARVIGDSGTGLFTGTFVVPAP